MFHSFVLQYFHLSKRKCMHTFSCSSARIGEWGLLQWNFSEDASWEHVLTDSEGETEASGSGGEV